LRYQGDLIYFASPELADAFAKTWGEGYYVESHANISTLPSTNSGKEKNSITKTRSILLHITLK